MERKLLSEQSDVLSRLSRVETKMEALTVDLSHLSRTMESAISEMQKQGRIQWPMISVLVAVAASVVTLLGVWMNTRLNPVETSLREVERFNIDNIRTVERQEERWSLFLNGKLKGQTP